MGIPGQRGALTVVNVFTPEDDPRNQGVPGGLPGSYHVVFTLSRPGIPLTPENRYAFESGLRGDSHLAITAPAFSPPLLTTATEVRIRCWSDQGAYNFRCLPNESGFLAKIVGELEATDLVDAERKAWRALAPNLSTWALHLDVPLHVHQVDVTELRTGNAHATFVNSYSEVPFSVVAATHMSPAFRSLASLYREALESSSPVFTFLCLFKMVEGIRARRKRLERDTRNTGQTYLWPTEVVPKDRAAFERWLNAIFPVRPSWGWDDMALESIFRNEAMGKPFEDVWSGILVPLRNDVAHALFTDTGEISLSVDDLLHQARIERWIPLLRAMVRRMLKNDFPDEFLTYLREDGTVGETSEDRAKT